MAEYRIQHFVPQWYLRNFSSNSGNLVAQEKIWVYDVTSKNLSNNKIYETAQDDYFYGIDGEFEKSLQLIENETSRGIQAVIKTKNIDELSDVTLNKIRKFILLQSSRTEAVKIITENFVENYLENEVKPRLREKYEDLPYFRDYIDSMKLDANFFEWMMKMSLGNIVTISDLKIFLVINQTKIPFFTSDNPVVKNNYFYKSIPVHGLQTPGIQIACPITEKLCLLLIHDDLYKIQLDSRSKILINEETDVDSFNCLQFLNCSRQVFSTIDNFDYLQHISDKTIRILNKFKKSRFEREYDDIQERNFQIRFKFLKNKREIEASLALYRKNSRESKKGNPIRNLELYYEGWKETDTIQKLVIEEYKTQMESET